MSQNVMIPKKDVSWFEVSAPLAPGTCNAGLVNNRILINLPKSISAVVGVGFFLHDGFNNSNLWISLNDAKSIKITFTSQLTQVGDPTQIALNYFRSTSIIIIHLNAFHSA